MYSLIENLRKNVTNLHKIFFTFWSHGYIMTAKIQIRQYAVFISPRKFYNADIKYFTVTLCLCRCCFRYEDSHSDTKKQLTPRRRRPHYPPITPNACLKDSAASSAFDCMWQEVRKLSKKLGIGTCRSGQTAGTQIRVYTIFRSHYCLIIPNCFFLG